MDWDTVRSRFQVCLQLAEGLGQPPIRAISHFRYAGILHGKGDMDAARRNGLDLGEMEAAVAGREKEIDAQIEANQAALEAACHWGVPTLVFSGEPLFGQDRIEVCLWRMRKTGLAKRP